jgi:hypothetical protein
MSAAGAIATRPRTAPPQAVRSLLLGNFFGPTGTPQVCEELSERLRIAGWPTLTASRYRNRLLRILDMTNSVWQRRNEYDVAQLDVFSGRAFCWAQACSEALLACRKPFVVSLHGGSLPRFADENPARVARLLRNAAAVTAPSAYLARRFRSVRSDIAEIPNPIDLTRHAFRLRRPIVPRIIWLRAFHEIYDPLGAVDVLRGVLAARIRQESTAVLARRPRGPPGTLLLARELKRALQCKAKYQRRETGTNALKASRATDALRAQGLPQFLR